MLAVIAPFVGFVLGIAFCRSSFEELVSDPTNVIGSRCLAVSVLYSVLIYAFATAYFLTFHTDWAFGYRVDGTRVPSAVILGLVLINAVSVPLGFVLAAPAVRRHRTKRLLSMAGIPTFIVLMTVLASARRLTVSANYAQFHGDFGVQGTAGTPLGYAIVWVGAVLLVTLPITLHRLRLLSKACRRRHC